MDNRRKEAPNLLKAPINKILDQTLVDGPGNRTAVFFQHCNLACRYCHNPETQQLCCHCGRCQEVCPAEALKLTGHIVFWNKQICINCGKNGAIEAACYRDRFSKNQNCIVTNTTAGTDQKLFRLLFHYLLAPQHFLYFLPLPQGQGSLRPIFCSGRT